MHKPANPTPCSRLRRSTLQWLGWQQQALARAGEAQDELLVLHARDVNASAHVVLRQLGAFLGVTFRTPDLQEVS